VNERASALSEAARRDLLDLARRSLEAYFGGEPPPRLASDRAEAFGQARGIFVTWRVGGELRGCIGTLAPEGDLARAVADFARRAALEDPRFPPMTAAELQVADVEISVLTAPEALKDASEIEIGLEEDVEPQEDEGPLSEEDQER